MVLTGSQVFFLTLLTGGASLFVYEGWQFLPLHHRFIFPCLLVQPYIFLYLCNQTNSSSIHIITPENHADHMVQYPYDFKLFHPNIKCKTCNFIKPARSKHCSLCKACVARADHHCIWVNNCLGRGNYKYFLALLASTSVLLAYGAYICYITLAPQVNDHFVTHPAWHISSYDGSTDLSSKIMGWFDRWLDILGTAFEIGGIYRGGVGFLALLTSPLPAGLLAYHIYLIWAGMTTNESAKWSDWQEDISDQLVFVTDLDETTEDAKQRWVGRWPKRSSQFLVFTSDGKEPRNVARNIKEVVNGADAAIWTRPKGLKELDNTYDLGFGGNLREALMN